MGSREEQVVAFLHSFSVIFVPCSPISLDRPGRAANIWFNAIRWKNSSVRGNDASPKDDLAMPRKSVAGSIRRLGQHHPWCLNVGWRAYRGFARVMIWGGRLCCNAREIEDNPASAAWPGSACEHTRVSEIFTPCFRLALITDFRASRPEPVRESGQGPDVGRRPLSGRSRRRVRAVLLALAALLRGRNSYLPLPPAGSGPARPGVPVTCRESIISLIYRG